MTFLTTLRVTKILCSFRLVLEEKTGIEIPRLEILKKFLANNFALSDAEDNTLEKFLANNFALSSAEDNTFEPLNRGGLADLPLLRTLLAIHQKS